MTLFSILIPTFNRPKELSNVLDSIRSNNLNSFCEYEILISDNCSNISYDETLKNFKDLNIVYRKLDTNIGPANNFRLLQSQSKGKYITLISDDDIYQDGHFLEALKLLEETKADVYCSHSYIKRGSKTLFPPSSRSDFFRSRFIIEPTTRSVLSMYENHFISTGCIFRDHVIKSDPWVDLDDRMYLTYLSAKYKICISHKYGAIYYQHPETLSSAGGPRAGLKFSTLISNLSDFVIRNDSIPSSTLRRLLNCMICWEYSKDILRFAMDKSLSLSLRPRLYKRFFPIFCLSTTFDVLSPVLRCLRKLRSRLLHS